MWADICVHDKNDGNPHAYIMLTMRPFEQGGTWGAKQKKEYILDQQEKKIYDPKKRQYKCNCGMIGRQMDIGDKLKLFERRLPVLRKHLEQYNIYLKFKDKKPLSEADKILAKAAHCYLKGVMNGHSSLPVNAWKSEYAKLTAEQKTLNLRYLALKDEVKEAEQIRKSIYSILRQEQWAQAPRKAQDMDR